MIIISGQLVRTSNQGKRHIIIPDGQTELLAPKGTVETVLTSPVMVDNLKESE